MQNGEPTIKDVLEVMQTSFGEIDHKLLKLDKIEKQGEYLHTRVDDMDVRMRSVEKGLVEVRTEMGEMRGEMGEMREQMVTKDYFKEVLDESLFDLKTELAIMVKKEDRKIATLVDELLKTSVLSPDAARRVLGMEPFPQNA